jgi:hypothetical protein
VRKLRTEQLAGSLLTIMLLFLSLLLISSYGFASGITGLRLDINDRVTSPDLNRRSLDMIWNERVIDTIVQSIVIFSSVAAVSLIFKGWLKE